MSKVKIAVTYSESVGGSSVKSLKESVLNVGAQPVDADYRAILPLREGLDKVFSDEKYRKEIFSEAKKNAEDFLLDIDCLMLSGNAAMIDPRLYGFELSENKKTDLARSMAELALIHVAINKGMPILGICGGHQILNTYFGGSIKELNAEELEKQKFMEYSEVEIDQKSALAGMIRSSKEDDVSELTERFFGAHFEYVEKVGGAGLIEGRKDADIAASSDYFATIARSKGDASIEGIESQYGSLVVGLQFHPEVGLEGLPGFKAIYMAPTEEAALKNRKIFTSFKQAAEAFKQRKKVNLQIKSLGEMDQRGVKERVKESNKIE